MASSSGSTEPKKSRFRRNGGASKAPGRSSQIKQVFDTTRANDPQLLPWMIGAFALVFLLLLVIGFAVGHPIYLGFIGLFLGVLAAMLVLGRRAESAAYKSIAGQPGASAAAMSSLKKGWRFDQEPVAAEMGRSRQVKDLSHASMVYRAIGRPGVVLVAEGPKGGAAKLLESERKRSARVLGPEVPIHLMRVGADDEAVPVDRLTKDMQKLPKVLTDDEVEHVTKRLRALGASRAGVPAGVDPKKVRVNRAAMRGR